jgi:hypothetical protein
MYIAVVGSSIPTANKKSFFMRNAGSLWLVAVIMLLLDLYVFWVLRAMSNNLSDKWRIALFSTYWLISLLAVIALLTFPYWRGQMGYKHLTEYVFAIILGLVFAKLLATVFFLVDDIRRGAMWLMSKLFRRTGADYVEDNSVIERSAFLSWLGLIVGGTLFGSLVYGFTNKYDYQLKKIKLSFKNLPSMIKKL